jgi:CDP-glycerol glycerophosphotransferase
VLSGQIILPRHLSELNVNPLLTVVIPVFNQETYLRKCLDSVLCQAFQDLEILVVDDGSTDATAAIAQEVARQDGRVRVLQQPNAGAGAARNHGLRHARGQFVHFVDADDWLVPGAYSRLQQALHRFPQADMLVQFS